MVIYETIELLDKCGAILIITKTYKYINLCRNFCYYLQWCCAVGHNLTLIGRTCMFDW